MSSSTPYQDQKHNDDLGKQFREVIFREARSGVPTLITGDSILMINLIGVLVRLPGNARKLLPWASVLELIYHQDDEKMTATMLKLGRG